jgi:hypothetical protein
MKKTNWGIRFALVDAICCVSTNPAENNTSEARVSYNPGMVNDHSEGNGTHPANVSAPNT